MDCSLVVNDPSTLILLSGGIDSTSLINYYIKKGYRVEGLHFQYGQDAKQSELRSSQKVSDYYGIKINIVNLGFNIGKHNYEYLCRNAVFIFNSVSFLANGFNNIALGIHSGTSYYDCNQDFIVNCQRILDGYFGGTIRLESPFINFTKQQIFEYCKNENIPVNLTYSCEVNEDVPCGYCQSCYDRRNLYGIE